VITFLSACQSSTGEIFDESGDAVGSYECYTSLAFDGSEIHIYSAAPDKDHVLFTQDDAIPLLAPFYRNGDKIVNLFVSKSCKDISSGRVEML
jgi:hypothetical protein